MVVVVVGGWGGAEQLLDTHLRAASTHFTRMRRLQLGYCRAISDQGLKDVARFVHAMEHCDLRGLRKITDASLTRFVHEARHLKMLDVRGCQGVGEKTLEEVSRSLPNCNFIYSHVN
jgi:hypothetical protein